jgi:hypothetical protein
MKEEQFEEALRKLSFTHHECWLKSCVGMEEFELNYCAM